MNEKLHLRAHMIIARLGAVSYTHLDVYKRQVISGMDEIRRIAALKTVPVDFPIPGVEVNKPVDPQVIETVELELYGETYPEPVRVENPKMPKCWPRL